MADDILDDDLFAPDPRTPEEQELDRLRNWLARPNWCLGRVGELSSGREVEAACLLAGVDPEVEIADLHQGYSWDFLPGAREKYRAATSSSNFDRFILDSIDEFHAIKPLGARPVTEIIAHALDAGFEIPWLDAALADEECRRYLPKSLLEAEQASATASPMRKMSEAQREKAHIRWGKDEISQALERVGRLLFDEWWHQSNSSRSSQAELAKRILEALQAEFPKHDEPRSLRTIEDRIRDWKRQSLPKAE